MGTPLLPGRLPSDPSLFQVNRLVFKIVANYVRSSLTTPSSNGHPPNEKWTDIIIKSAVSVSRPHKVVHGGRLWRKLNTAVDCKRLKLMNASVVCTKNHSRMELAWIGQ